MAATLAPPPAMHSAPSYGAQKRLKSTHVAAVYSTPWLGAGISPAAAPVQLVARVCTTQRGRAAVLSSHAFRFGGAESWPMDWMLPTLEDVGHFFQQHVLKQQVSESAILDDVMSRQIICVTTGVSLSSLVNTLKKVSGVCVVDDERRLIGIVSRADVRDKQGETVQDVMSSPPIACRPEATVRDAAALMLKHSVHRIPIVDAQARVVGMVTRSDIFGVVEQQQAA